MDMDAGRVVCLSVREILEKLKSLCSLRRHHLALVEEAGETASSTREQGLVRGERARGTFDFGTTNADPIAWPRPSRTKLCHSKCKPMRLP